MNIEYNHKDIINKKNVIIFEANYKLDQQYKNWFDTKYSNLIPKSVIHIVNKKPSDANWKIF